MAAAGGRPRRTARRWRVSWRCRANPRHPCSRSRQTPQKSGRKPPYLPRADDGAGQGGEGEVEVGASPVAHGQAPKAVQPGEAALDHLVGPSQLLAALNATSRDVGLDAAGAALAAAPAVVVAPAGVEFVGTLPRSSTVSGPLPGPASSVAASIMLSLCSAALNVTPRGVPWASVTTWRFVPGLRGPSGSARPRTPSRAGWRPPGPPGANPGHQHREAVPATPGAVQSEPRPRAAHPTCASTGCRSSRVPAATRATGCPCATRTGCPQAPRGPMHGAAHLSAGVARAAAAAPRPPTCRQEQAVPCRSQRRKARIAPKSPPEEAGWVSGVVVSAAGCRSLGLKAPAGPRPQANGSRLCADGRSGGASPGPAEPASAPA